MKIFHFTAILVIMALLPGTLCVYGNDNSTSNWDGSLVTPVHRIPLLDEDGEQIIPEYRYSFPFSARQTCGPCHSYQTISEGLHFNASRANTPAGRQGEPWIWVDELTGTQIPLSYRDWKGVRKPEELGLTPWKFTQLFGRHLPGGSIAEPQNDLLDPESRWDVSGKVEMNCLGCHNASPLQNQSEWAIQMARENFRWAATAAGNLGEVGGMASRMEGTWTPYDGPDPDDKEWAIAPFVRYNLTQFDSKHQTFFDVVYKVKDERCLYCHSVSKVGSDRMERQGDVHTAAGIACVDCHRNGLDHQMIRGYPGEADEKGLAFAKEFTCEGCHGYPKAESDKNQSHRFGAPYPQHKGLPSVHLEKLACTTCHSGPLPNEELTQVRTSRANRLGIHGKAQWYTDLPQIVEPVFASLEDGKIAPHRLMWPAFWARLEGEKVIPLPPTQVAESVDGIFDAEKQVGKLLAALALDPEATGEPVFVKGGKFFRKNIDGEVDGEPCPPDTPMEITWGRDQEGRITPLISPFQLNEDGTIPFDIETRIMKTLEALSSVEQAPGVPVSVFKGTLYRLNSDGILEREKWDIQSIDQEASIPSLDWLTEDNRLSSLVPALIQNAVVETDGTEQVLSKAQVVLALYRLNQLAQESGDQECEYVYVSGGKMFKSEGKSDLLAFNLEVSDHPTAAPYLWPMSHDVRPAEQSLGAQDCDDCHRQNSPFLFPQIQGLGPLKTNQVASKQMYEFMDLDADYHQMFSLSFAMRPLYKTMSLIVAALIGAVILLFGLMGLRSLLQWLNRCESMPDSKQ